MWKYKFSQFFSCSRSRSSYKFIANSFQVNNNNPEASSEAGTSNVLSGENSGQEWEGRRQIFLSRTTCWIISGSTSEREHSVKKLSKHVRQVLIFIFSAGQFLLSQNQIKCSFILDGCNVITYMWMDGIGYIWVVGAMLGRARWDWYWNIKNHENVPRQLYSYVKLNFKASLFSSTFWFERSFLAESAFLVSGLCTL